MANPLVAIVGRPNVGKSTLFNKIAGRKISITENRPGVTRDRLYADAVWRGKKFTVVDTGGIELKSADVLWKEILRQADAAIDMAQVILWMVDGKEELTAAEPRRRLEKLRRCKKAGRARRQQGGQLFAGQTVRLLRPRFGRALRHFGGALAGHRRRARRGGILLRERRRGGGTTASRSPWSASPTRARAAWVNRLLGFERTIVTDIAGTTRDAIDTPFEMDGQKYTPHRHGGHPPQKERLRRRRVLQRAARLRRGAPRRRVPARRRQHARG